jgi:hypothetical protein
MSDDPAKRTATEAMRLKPAMQRREPTPAERLPSHLGPEGATAEILRRRIVDARELHKSSEYGDPPHCLECLMPHPCRTYTILADPPRTETTREDSTQ